MGGTQSTEASHNNSEDNVKKKIANSPQTSSRHKSSDHPNRKRSTRAAPSSNTETAVTFFLSAQTHQIAKARKEKSPEKAFNCYLKAAKLGHKEALPPLERLGEEMSAEQQIKLSHLYEKYFKNQERADYWREKATEVANFQFK